MANDFQRGYLSGIVQRGARTVSPDARATQVRPLMPAVAPTFSPILDSPVPISSDFPGEVESFIEPVPAQRPHEGDRKAQPPKITTRIVSQDSETESTSTIPAAEPLETREPAAPDNHSDLSATGPAAIEPLHSPSPTSLGLTSTERDQWGDRLPRLIKVSTEKLNRESIDQAPRTNDQVVAADFPSRQITVEAGPPQAESNSIIDRSPPVQLIEKRDTEFTSLLTRNYQAAEAKLVELTPSHEAAPHPTTQIISEPAVSVSNQLPEPSALRETVIETEREVIVVQTLPEERETAVTWNPPPSPRDQFSTAKALLPSPRQESPKLTINRLDVQIVNQSVPPVAPVPPATAPAPQSDGWNNLERYHLGHLDLIL